MYKPICNGFRRCQKAIGLIKIEISQCKFAINFLWWSSWLAICIEREAANSHSNLNINSFCPYLDLYWLILLSFSLGLPVDLQKLYHVYVIWKVDVKQSLSWTFAFMPFFHISISSLSSFWMYIGIPVFHCLVDELCDFSVDIICYGWLDVQLSKNCPKLWIDGLSKAEHIKEMWDSLESF